MKKNETTPELQQRLQSFRDLVKTDKVVNFWETKEELRAQVGEAISTAIRNEERVGWVRGDQALNQSQVQKFLQMQDELDRLRLQTSKVSPEEAFKSLSDMARMFLMDSLRYPTEVANARFYSSGSQIDFFSHEGQFLAETQFKTSNDKASARLAVTRLVELGLWELIKDSGQGECIYAPSALAFNLPRELLESELTAPTSFNTTK